MSKPHKGRRRAENEAQAVAKTIRTSARKLNLVAQLIRGKDANKALAEPGTLEQFMTSATEPVGGTPEDLAKSARADFEKYARLIGELNIRTN